MIEPTAKVNPDDLLKLGKAIDIMTLQLNRDLAKTVNYAAFRFVFAGRANTPKAKGKKRKVRGNAGRAGQTWDIKTRKRDKRKIGSQFLAVHKQRGPMVKVLLPDTMWGTPKQKGLAREQRRKIMKKWGTKPHVEAAKASWNRAFTDLGKSAKRNAELNKRRIQMASRARKYGGKFTPIINVTNELSYIDKIAPGLEQIALAKAGKALLFRANQAVEKQARKWK